MRRVAAAYASPLLEGGSGCCREDIVLYRILPSILALLIVVALDCGDIGAQDYWRVAFEDLPPIDFPEASGSEADSEAEAKKTTPGKATNKIKPLPSPSPSGGGLRPEDVLDLDSTPSDKGNLSTRSDTEQIPRNYKYCYSNTWKRKTKNLQSFSSYLSRDRKGTGDSNAGNYQK